MNPRTFARVGGIALSSVLLAGVAAPAMAGSFYVQEQSTRAQGRANAGVGAPGPDNAATTKTSEIKRLKYISVQI